MNRITDLDQIDRTTKEGKLLFASLIKLSTELYTDKTPFEILDELYVLAREIDLNS